MVRHDHFPQLCSGGTAVQDLMLLVTSTCSTWRKKCTKRNGKRFEKNKMKKKIESLWEHVCFFDIITPPRNPYERKQFFFCFFFKGDHAFWVKLDGLQFQRSYSVRVIEKFGGNREADVKFTLNIPSCRELRGYSFKLCREFWLEPYHFKMSPKKYFFMIDKHRIFFFLVLYFSK